MLRLALFFGCLLYTCHGDTPIVESNKGTRFYGEGDAYTLTCNHGSSANPPTYEWKVNGATSPGETGKTLQVVAQAQETAYVCVVAGSDASDGASQPILVKGNKIMEFGVSGSNDQPLVGTPVTFNCQCQKSQAALKSPATYRWINSRDQELPGETAAQATITFTDCRDTGKVKCQITVDGETIEAKINVRPVALPSTPAAPKLSINNATFVPGQRVVLTCHSPQDCISSYSLERGGTTITDAFSGEKVFSSYHAGQAGTYTCRAVNYDASKTKSEASNSLTLNEGGGCSGVCEVTEGGKDRDSAASALGASLVTGLLCLVASLR